MRLLQLWTTSGELLELHPNISVVQGLDEPSRRALVDAVAGLPVAVAPAEPGLLEAQGVLLDLSSANLRMLDLDRDDLDPIVRASDLPAGEVSPEEPKLRTVERDLEAARHALEREVAAEVDASTAVAAAEQALADARAEHEQALADEHRWANELERLDLRSQELAAERQRLVAATTGDGADAHSNDGDVGPAAALADIDARLEELSGSLAALSPVDGSAVEGALERLWGLEPEERQPSAEAISLADELDELDRDIARRTSELGEDDGDLPSLTDARTRLDEAREGLLEAEQALRSPRLDRDDVAALEDAHQDLLDAIDRADGRFAGARARRRVEELRGAEEAALERRGFMSYADYVMGHSHRPMDPAVDDAVAAAREALAAAEEEWALQQARADEVLARAALLERRHLLIERAGALLGHPAGASAAEDLRALRVSKTSATDCVAELQQALDAAGLAVGDEHLDPEELEAMAVAWLSEEGEVDQRRQSVEAEIARLRDERAAESVPVPPASEPPTGDGEDGEDDRRPAENQIRRREGELATVAQQQADVDDRRHELSERRGAERVELLAAKLQEREADRSEAAERAAERGRIRAEAEERVRSLEGSATELRSKVDPAPDADPTGGERVDWYLLARLAAVRAVPLAGSLPILLDDALRGIDEQEVCRVLDRLEPLAEAVQMIVLSEDPAVHRWATSAGPARAAVVAPVPA